MRRLLLLPLLLAGCARPTVDADGGLTHQQVSLVYPANKWGDWRAQRRITAEAVSIDDTGATERFLEAPNKEIERRLQDLATFNTDSLDLRFSIGFTLER